MKALQQHLEHIAISQGIPATQIADLPTSKTAELPRAIVGETTKLEAIETQIVEEKSPEVTLLVGATPTSSGQLATLDEIARLPMKERAIAILNQLSADGFDLSRCIADQITCICGNQRGGKGTLLAWGLKSGGRNHDKYRYASELLDAMIRELSGLGLDEKNNWGINF